MTKMVDSTPETMTLDPITKKKKKKNRVEERVGEGGEQNLI